MGVLKKLCYSKCMKNLNLSITGKELYDLRRRAIKMKLKGAANKAVIQAFDIANSTFDKWWALYRKGGFKALYPKKRGRKPGSHRSLNPEQEQEIRSLIVEKTPDQLKDRKSVV